MDDDSLNRDIAGALATFWAGGSGPPHTTLSLAFGLASYEEPEEDASSNKEQRVLLALRKAPEGVGRRIAEELLALLRKDGYLDADVLVGTVRPEARRLRAAFQRHEASLSAEGYITWPPEAPASSGAPPLGDRGADEPVAAKSIQAVLDAAYSVWTAQARWPTLQWITTQLRRLGTLDQITDAGQVIRELGGDYVRNVRNLGGQEGLALTVDGLARVHAARARELLHFMTALRVLVRRYSTFDSPPFGTAQLVVERAELVAEPELASLRLTDLDWLKAFDLLTADPWLCSGSRGPDPESGDFALWVSDNITRYTGVDSIESYVAARDEAFNRVGGQLATSGWMRPVTMEQVPVVSIKHQPMDPRKVFVIHGRDKQAREALFSFLRLLDLQPVLWEELVASVGQGTPYTGEVVRRAFDEASVVIALLTPDDQVLIHPDLAEPPDESGFRSQARPNVLLETGMALALNLDRTIIVEIGEMRPVSDLEGRNVVRLRGDFQSVDALATRLETAGCPVRRSGDWGDPQRFANLAALRRKPDPPQNLFRSSRRR